MSGGEFKTYHDKLGEALRNAKVGERRPPTPRERAIVAYDAKGRGLLLFAHGGAVEMEWDELGCEMDEYVAESGSHPEEGIWVKEFLPRCHHDPEDGVDYGHEATWRPLTAEELKLFQSGQTADLHGLWTREGIPAMRDTEKKEENT
jgi:hypothetical protein